MIGRELELTLAARIRPVLESLNTHRTVAHSAHIEERMHDRSIGEDVVRLVKKFGAKDCLPRGRFSFTHPLGVQVICANDAADNTDVTTFYTPITGRWLRSVDGVSVGIYQFTESATGAAFVGVGTAMDWVHVGVACKESREADGATEYPFLSVMLRPDEAPIIRILVVERPAIRARDIQQYEQQLRCGGSDSGASARRLSDASSGEWVLAESSPPLPMNQCFRTILPRCGLVSPSGIYLNNKYTNTLRNELTPEFYSASVALPPAIAGHLAETSFLGTLIFRIGASPSGYLDVGFAMEDVHSTHHAMDFPMRVTQSKMWQESPKVDQWCAEEGGFVRQFISMCEKRTDEVQAVVKVSRRQRVRLRPGCKGSRSVFPR